MGTTTGAKLALNVLAPLARRTAMKTKFDQNLGFLNTYSNNKYVILSLTIRPNEYAYYIGGCQPDGTGASILQT